MPHFEKHSQHDLTDQPKATSSHSGSPERLQQLRKANGFTSDGSLAKARRERAARVLAGKDQGKYPYDPMLETSVNERGKATEKMRIEQKGLRGGWPYERGDMRNYFQTGMENVDRECPDVSSEDRETFKGIVEELRTRRVQLYVDGTIRGWENLSPDSDMDKMKKAFAEGVLIEVRRPR